jgi:hypothetical protein
VHWVDLLLSLGRKSRTAAAITLVVFSALAEVVGLGTASGRLPGPTTEKPVATIAKGANNPATPATANAASARVIVPTGAGQCPSSGAGASCGNGMPVAERGTAILPGSMPACPQDAGKPALPAPGACVGVVPAHSASAAQPTVSLTVDKSLLAYGDAATLMATSSVDVTGTPDAIEIFDRTTGDLIGACTQATKCLVAYSGKAGTHNFAAFLLPPTTSLPKTGMDAVSNDVAVLWLGVGLVAGNPAPPGQPITFTAFANVDVASLGYVVTFRDSVSHQVITYCGQGTTCSTSVIRPSGGAYALFATLEPRNGGTAPNPVTSTSPPVYGIWLAVDLMAGSITTGGTAQLSASANADLSATPWSIYLFTSDGALVGQPCHAVTCTATVPYSAGDNRSYVAMIARVARPGAAGAAAGNRGGASKLQVIARSAPAKPLHLMWGVDSCKSSLGLYGQVASAFGGAPDFWGRYLTTTYNCPGLSGAEIATAKAHHMGILPIFDDYDCSNYVGYATGMGYANAAVAAARRLGIPAGTGLVVDIEPPGDACPGAWFVDSSFLEAWYDGVTKAGYAPVYYGDATPGSAFQKGYCPAVASHPEYATHAFIWSFEPSLIGGWKKSNVPGYAPNWVGCGADQSAWQYSLSAGSTPDVDTDEALSRLPLWFP